MNLVTKETDEKWTLTIRYDLEDNRYNANLNYKKKNLWATFDKDVRMVEKF